MVGLLKIPDMAAFIADFKISVSSDGKTLTIEDISTYGDNDENYVISDFETREVVLLDANGEEIATVDLGSELTADCEISADIWVNATLTLYRIDPIPNYSKNHLFPFFRITKNLYRKLLKGGCCQNVTVENALTHADIFLRGEEIEAPSGNGPAWQNDVDAAYAYLNAVS